MKKAVWESNKRRRQILPSMTSNSLCRLRRKTRARFKGVARLTALFTHKSVRERIEADMQRFKLLVETSESSS